MGVGVIKYTPPSTHSNSSFMFNALRYVYDLVTCLEFREHEFGRIFNEDWYDESVQIQGFLTYLMSSGQLDLTVAPRFFADVETIDDAIAKWQSYNCLLYTSDAADE